MLITPQMNYVTCKNEKEQYRMFYTAWGEQETSTKTLLCVHGLGRNCRDWDFVGNHFAKLGYYVIAPDIVGHGNSDYLKDPTQYSLAGCVSDILQMVKTLGLTNINWLGTSMGGLIGISLAASGYNPIQKMILNDIGAEVERTGLARISNSYNAALLEFDSYTLAKDYIINISREFGDLPDKIWDIFAANSLQKNAHGKYTIKKDTNLGRSFDSTPNDQNLELWPYWEKVSIPTLVIRGEHSDILSTKTVQRMQEININTQHVEVSKTGHAPFLYNESHFTILNKFFN